jgi:predicted nuclease of predicted toxin-antitoxin system
VAPRQRRDEKLAEPTGGLLFDENLSSRLVTSLADLYPGSAHVSALNLFGASDNAIWQAAGSRGLAIVTKDEDFERLGSFYGSPPKVICIRLGNCSTEQIIALLRQRHREITAFLFDKEAAFLGLA